MGTAASTAGAAGPFRDYGPDEAVGELSRSTPRQADDTATQPSGSGPTRQSDIRDSEPDYLLRPSGTLLDYIVFLFKHRSAHSSWGPQRV